MKLADILNPTRQVPKSPGVIMTEVMADEMCAMRPGEMMELVVRGRVFMVIDRDDFEHVALVGGMKIGKVVR